MLASVFDAFVEQSPISVMMRGLMERVFRPQRLDEIFEAHAKQQYTRELLFSTLVNLLSLVVCGIQPSVNAAKDRGFNKPCRLDGIPVREASYLEGPLTDASATTLFN